MNPRAQGALEYLLVIGGAILVSAIVISIISATPAAVDQNQRVKCLAQKNFGGCIAAGCAPMRSDMATGANTPSEFFICMAGSLCGTPSEVCPIGYVGMGANVPCNSTCSGYNVSGCGVNLTQPGNYKLTQNISGNNCLTIQLNIGGNRTIDCQDKIITGPPGIYGIRISSAQDVTVQNCKITGYLYGIYATSSSNITLSNNDSYGNSWSGIYATSSSNITLSNNHSHDNSQYGIRFNGTTASINNCTACNNAIWDVYCNATTSIAGAGNIATKRSADCSLSPAAFSNCP